MRRDPFARRDRAAARPLRRGRGARPARGGARDEVRRYDSADRDEAEEAYGDYVDAVETATEALADMRDRFGAHARRGRRRGVRGCVQPRRPEALARPRPGDREPLMARIEDYALLGDLQTAALVERGGSVDWLCFPRFDSGACFAALLGEPENGRWLLAPDDGGDDARAATSTTRSSSRRPGRRRRRRRARPRLHAAARQGARRRAHRRGRRGHASTFRSELTIRFDYGRVVPVGAQAHARGEHSCRARGPGRALLSHAGARRAARTCARSRSSRSTRASAFPSSSRGSRRTRTCPSAIDPEQALAETESFWREWSEQCELRPAGRMGRDRAPLAHRPQGADVRPDRRHRRRADDVAARVDRRRAQLGLPLLLAPRRDAHAARAPAAATTTTRRVAWRRWLLRAVAGDPADIQIMYGVAGERRLTEYEVPWLAGYEGSAPVRIGNAASEQLQLDVYGEVIDALYQARVARARGSSRRRGGSSSPLLDHLEEAWQRARRGHLGDPRRAAPLRPLEGDGVGGLRSRGADGRGTGTRGARRPLARGCATRSTQEVCERGFDDEARLLHAVVRVGRARREPSSCSRSSASCPRPTRASEARSKRSSAS